MILSVLCCQKLQSAQGKAAEKSPQTPQGWPDSEPVRLDGQIRKQGELVRQLKADKAAKVRDNNLGT